MSDNLIRMSVPRGFWVGIPAKVSHHLRRFGSDRPAPNEVLPGTWIDMGGGHLPVPVLMRIDQSEDGRFIPTGLVIGLRSRSEITWETLRQIQPATLIGYLFEGFDPKALTPYVREVAGEDFDEAAWERDDEDFPRVTAEEMNEFARSSAAARLWSDTRLEVTDLRTAAPKATAATDLGEFARIYQLKLARSPHRATTATAREMNISRATALRRLKEARAAGLLPPAPPRREDPQS